MIIHYSKVNDIRDAQDIIDGLNSSKSKLSYSIDFESADEETKKAFFNSLKNIEDYKKYDSMLDVVLDALNKHNIKIKVDICDVYHNESVIEDMFEDANDDKEIIDVTEGVSQEYVDKFYNDIEEYEKNKVYYVNDSKLTNEERTSLKSKKGTYYFI